MSEFVHFGPVWGRPRAKSMALCMENKDPGRESITMTRGGGTVTCQECLDMLAKHDANNQPGGRNGLIRERKAAHHE